MTTRVRQDGEPRGDRPEDGEGDEAVEARPVHLRESAEGEGGRRRRHLHRVEQRRRQGQWGGCSVKVSRGLKVRGGIGKVSGGCQGQCV